MVQSYGRTVSIEILYIYYSQFIISDIKYVQICANCITCINQRVLRTCPVSVKSRMNVFHASVWPASGIITKTVWTQTTRSMWNSKGLFLFFFVVQPSFQWRSNIIYFGVEFFNILSTDLLMGYCVLQEWYWAVLPIQKNEMVHLLGWRGFSTTERDDCNCDGSNFSWRSSLRESYLW